MVVKTAKEIVRLFQTNNKQLIRLYVKHVSDMHDACVDEYKAFNHVNIHQLISDCQVLNTVIKMYAFVGGPITPIFLMLEDQQSINRSSGRRHLKSSIRYEDVARRWSEYLGQLFNDFRTNEEFTPLNALSGPPITKDEIRWALHKSKTNKAAGPDEVVTEMLKALGDTGVNILYSLVNKIYDSGEIPNDMLNSVFIALPKKPNTLDCDQHRKISLMSHTLKLLLKIVLERCRSKIHPEIAQCQYGFMPDKGTRNAIFTLRMLSERSIQHQQNIYICFIDYKKAFDRVRHKRLFKMIRDV